MQIYRRLERNHALDYALRCAEELGKPLVVYEGLRIDYPWASRRHHRFVLEGMQANAARAGELGLNYWPFVETGEGPGSRPPPKALRARVPGRDRRLPLLHRPAPGRGPRPEGRGPGLRRGLELGRPAVASRPRGVRRRAPAPADPQGLRRGLAAPRRGEAADPGRGDEAREGPLRRVEGEGRRGLRGRLAPRRDGAPGRWDAGRNAGRSRAPARVPEEAAARVRGGALGAALARRGPRERALAVPPLRPRLDRGGRGGGSRHDREVVPRRAPAPQPGQARGLLLRRPRRELLPRRGAHLERRRLPVALVPPRRRGEPGDGAAGVGAPDPGGARRRTPAPGSTRPRSSRTARPTTRCGTRRSASWWRPAPSTTTCGCCGARRCSSGRPPPPRPTARSSTSTTSTRSTAATRTPTPASCGASASSTGRGRRSGRSSGPYGTCRPTTRRASST